MGKHYTTEFKQKIIDEYKSGKSGGYQRVAKKYGLSDDTVYHWVVKDRNDPRIIREENAVKAKSIEGSISDIKEDEIREVFINLEN